MKPDPKDLHKMIPFGSPKSENMIRHYFNGRWWLTLTRSEFEVTPESAADLKAALDECLRRIEQETKTP
jgi:hypothetical protein